MFNNKKGMMMGGYVAAFIVGLILGIVLIVVAVQQGIISPSLLGIAVGAE